MKKILLIFKLIDLLFVKYDDYISFTFTKGVNGGIGYEKWNIYTSIINHNDFETKDELIFFMQNIIEKPELYENHRKNILKENLKNLKEEIIDTEKELEKL